MRSEIQNEIRDYLKGKVAAIAPYSYVNSTICAIAKTDARCRGHLDDAINNIVGFAAAGARTSCLQIPVRYRRNSTRSKEEDVVRHYKKRDPSPPCRDFGVSRDN